MTYVKRGLPIRGNMLHRQDGNISVVLWQDTKPVLMTSTAHDPTTTITTTKKQMETQYQLNAKNLLQNTTSLWAEWILVISIGSIIRFE